VLNLGHFFGVGAKPCKDIVASLLLAHHVIMRSGLTLWRPRGEPAGLFERGEQVGDVPVLARKAEAALTLFSVWGIVTPHIFRRICIILKVCFLDIKLP
jgi:hypothetical protein